MAKENIQNDEAISTPTTDDVTTHATGADGSDQVDAGTNPDGNAGTDVGTGDVGGGTGDTGTDTGSTEQNPGTDVGTGGETETPGTGDNTEVPGTGEDAGETNENKPAAPILNTTQLEVNPGSNLPLRFTIPLDCTLTIEIVENKGSISIRNDTASYIPHSPEQDELVSFIAYSVTADGVKSDPMVFEVLVKKRFTVKVDIDSETDGEDYDGEEVSLMTSEAALPYNKLQLAVGDSKTITLVSPKLGYDFEDVFDIELKDYQGNALTLTKVSNKAFKLTATAATLAEEDLEVLVKSTENIFITLKLGVTVKEVDQFVACDFSKDIIDICPGNTVPFTFSGVDADIIHIDQGSGNVIENSALKIDINKRTVTCDKVGNYVQAIVVVKGNLKRTIYLQATSSNIISVDPESIELNTLQEATIKVVLTGLDYTVAIDDDTVIEFDKNSGIVTPLKAGSATITFTGTRGELKQEASTKVSVRDAVQPTTPVLQTETTVVRGGENIYLDFDIGKKGDKLSARLDADSKGGVTVDGNVVAYAAYKPDTETKVKIYVRTTSVDGLESAEVEVEVTVLGVPYTDLIAPDSVTVTEGETLDLGIKTNATSLSIISSVPEFLKVNSSKRTVTGVKYGEAVITITAQAVNCKAVTKEIPVTIRPGKVNKPVLTSTLRSVTEGKTLTMKFIVDKENTLKAKEVTDAGNIEIEGNVVNWTAPLITEEERQVFNFEVYSVRDNVNTESDKLTFSVVVLKAKEEQPDTGDEEPVDETDKLSYSDLEAALRSDVITFEDKIALVKTRGQSLAVTTLTRLLSYNETMSSSNKYLTSTVGAAKNYELYMAIRTVLELTENDKFQALFTLVNLIFKEYANDAYSSVKLNRFDREWTGGDRNKYSYQNITTLLTMLCDIMKRASNLNRIDFSIVFDTEKTVYTERVRESVIKYYTL